MRTFLWFCLILKFVSSQHLPVTHNGNDNTPISHLEAIASLQLTSTEVQFFCAGIFISHKAVLTLATCFYHNDVLLNPEEVRVVAGSQFRFDKELNTFSGVLEEILIHENFSRASLENNIAIGFLENWVPDDNIKIVAIDDIAYERPDEGTNCEIFGWSITTRYGGSPHLLSGDVVIDQTEKCNVMTNKVTSTTLCAGPYFVNGCETDDGSPLICNKKFSGLIDFRPDHYCSIIHTNRLGTYVDLSEFNDWISDHAASGKAVMNFLMLVLSAVMIKIFN